MLRSILFCLAVGLPIVIPVAVMEIYNDTNPQGWFWAKEGQWGKTKFVDPFWEERIDIPLPFIKYWSRYHGVLFLGIILPGICLFIPLIGWVFSYNVLPEQAPRYMSALSFVLLAAAIFVGVQGLEDFFYFLIQTLFKWYEPRALKRVVIDKDFAWFKDWLPPIFGLNIPGHWLACPAGALILLYIRQRWILK